jgi:hypothetical protein
MIYKTYKEAHNHLGIPGSYQRGTHGTAETGVTSLKITSHPDSYDKIIDNGQTIYYVGKGNKPTPAHPIKTQSAEEQYVFRKSIETQKKFPVLYKAKPKQVELLGYYIVKGLKKSKRGAVTFYYAILKRCK